MAKKKKKTNHVVAVSSKSGDWAVRKSGSVRATKIFKTKDEAEKYGVEISKNEKTELYIHGKNGKIQNRNSYGNDPFPPKDKKK